MQAKDIPDAAFLDAIREAIRRRNLMPPIPRHGWISATSWDVASVLAGHPELAGTAEATVDWPNMPRKVILAKARKLIQRGLMDGCSCGCRGDWEVCG